MRTASLAAGAALAVAVLGSTGEAAAQGNELYGYCHAWPQNWRPGERAALTDVFRYEHDSRVDDRTAEDLHAAFEQAWNAQIQSAHRFAIGGFSCLTFYNLPIAKEYRDNQVEAYVNGGRPFHNSAWLPNGTATAQTASPPVAQSAPPPPVSQSAQPAPAMPSLVVRESDAEERARQLNEENARRNREAAERDAANQARYAQQQREHEAAMARHRAAQERYRRECERVRAQGGSCVISR